MLSNQLSGFQRKEPAENAECIMNPVCDFGTTFKEDQKLLLLSIQMFFSDKQQCSVCTKHTVENISMVLCPWSNSLCFADSLATGGGPVVVVTLVQSPLGPFSFFFNVALGKINFFLPWRFPCALVFRVSSWEVVMVARWCVGRLLYELTLSNSISVLPVYSLF